LTYFGGQTLMVLKMVIRPIAPERKVPTPLHYQFLAQGGLKQAPGRAAKGRQSQLSPEEHVALLEADAEICDLLRLHGFEGPFYKKC
jgi:hypothetical protein